VADTIERMPAKSARVGFTLPESLKAHFVAQAEAEETDLSYVLVRALERQRMVDLDRERDRRE
jgi:hypothetical protein